MDIVFKWITYGMYLPLTLIPLYVAIKGSNEEKSLLKNTMDVAKNKVE